MKELIGWILVALSCLGGLYTIGLIISFAILQKDRDEYLDDYECDCDGCKR